jgi:hypothetical protein
MKFSHHGLQIELHDDWWAETGMADFRPTSDAYRADPDAFPDRQIHDVRIEDAGPVCRGPGVSIFNDNDQATARERVVAILRGFRSGAAIPPVEIVNAAPGYPHQYKLTHGAHRSYCSLAAGFTHVPAVRGLDWNSLDR